MKTYRQQEKPMDYDKELTKLATAYNNADYPKVNSVALGLLDDYRQLNTQMKAQLNQLQYENAALRLTLEHSSTKIASLLEEVEALEWTADQSE
jgi:hypothetical protein